MTLIIKHLAWRTGVIGGHSREKCGKQAAGAAPSSGGSRQSAQELQVSTSAPRIQAQHAQHLAISTVKREAQLSKGERAPSWARGPEGAGMPEEW